MQEELFKHVKSAKTTKSKIVALLLMGIPLTSKGYYKKLNNLSPEQSTLGGVNGTLSLLKATKLFEYITKVQPGGEGNRLGAQYCIDPEFKLTFDQAVKLSKEKLVMSVAKKKPVVKPAKSVNKPGDKVPAMLKEIQFKIMNLVMAELNPLLVKAKKSIITDVTHIMKEFHAAELKKWAKENPVPHTLEAVSDIDSISALLCSCVEKDKKISITIE